MKNSKVIFVMSLIVLITLLSCQKELLPDPQLSNQVAKSDTINKRVIISADTSKTTIYLTTDSLKISEKSESISVDYLKTFSAKAGDSDYFILQSNTTWKIASYPSWVTVSPLSGTGNAHITVTVKENTGAQRTDVITISGTGVLRDASISALQLAGSSIQSSLSVDWLKTFSAIAGDKDYFIVTSNTTWKIESFPNWVTVSPLTGTGKANVTVTVQANTGIQRTGTIIISGTGVAKNASINVLQVAAAPAPIPDPTPIPIINETVYTLTPFLGFGGTIINKKFVAPSSYTKPLFEFANQSVTFERNYIEANHNTATDLITISNAKSAQTVKFYNNVFQFKNVNNHSLAVGSEGSGVSDNFYDGAEFVGNKLIGIGDMTLGQNHAIFLGFNRGGIVKYNFLDNCPDAIVLKAKGDDNSAGIVSYNLIKNATNYGVIVKGIQNTKIYNNTFYADNSVKSYASFIEILKDPTGGKGSTGTIIKNNIFYSTGKQWLMIQIEDAASLEGLQCDYNVYYRSGSNQEIAFFVNDGTKHYYTFAQWQALGFDKHSVILNTELDPATLIPSKTTQSAVNLGTNYITGIDVSNVWNRNNIISKVQVSNWQNGAYVK